MSRTYRDIKAAESCEPCEGTGWVFTKHAPRVCRHFRGDPACNCFERCEKCDGAGVVHSWETDPELPNEETCATCGGWRKKP